MNNYHFIIIAYHGTPQEIHRPPLFGYPHHSISSVSSNESANQSFKVKKEELLSIVLPIFVICYFRWVIEKEILPF